MMDATTNAEMEIARALCVQALTPGGASSTSLVGKLGVDGKKVGEFVGELYATVLAKVKAANRA